MNVEVAVLMSTYNGSLYINDFFDSLKKQTYKNFTLFIRDDCSNDNTSELINDLLIHRSLRVVIIPSTINKGAKMSFNELILYALNYKNKFNYFMFADQDDYWLPDKIEISVNEIKQFDNTRPLLVHSDLMVTDEKLNIKADSFWKYQNLNPKITSLNRLLMQNNVTGCTMIINRKLAKLSTPISPDAIMHDWWIALVASQFGVISSINKPLILYRQHDSNSIGAVKFDFNYILYRMKRKATIEENILQAKSFLEVYNGQEFKSSKLLRAYISLDNRGYVIRVGTILKYKFLKHGLIRNIRLLITGN